MQIHGSTHVQGPQPINSINRAPATQPAAQPDNSAGVDQLDISQEADFVSRIRELPDVRADRVADIRAAIESGTYETSDKLDFAVNRLFDEIG